MPRKAITLGTPDNLPSGKVRWSKMYHRRRWKSSAYDHDSRRNRSAAWSEFLDWREEVDAQLQVEGKSQSKSDKVKYLEFVAETNADYAETIGNQKEAALQRKQKELLEELSPEEIAQLYEATRRAEPDEWLGQKRHVANQGKKNRKQTDPDITACVVAEKHLAVLQSQVKSGQASIGQYGVKRNAIMGFVEWFGETRGLDTLSEQDITEFYQHMAARIAKGENPTTISTYHGKVKQFLEAISEDNPDIPTPRNLRSKRYIIKPGNSKIETYTVDECKKLLELASPRVELWLCLMVNIGAYQSDISDLQAHEVDWVTGRIIRPRSKEANAPTINWLLWDRTWELLQEQGNQQGRVLTKEDGNPLVTTGIKADGKEWKRDAIVSSWRHLVRKAKRPVRGEAAFPEDWHKTLKQFRKTSASLIETSPHAEFVDVFLDHSRVARRHYLKGQIVPKFDEAVKWLGEQYGLKTRR